MLDQLVYPRIAAVVKLSSHPVHAYLPHHRVQVIYTQRNQVDNLRLQRVIWVIGRHHLQKPNRECYQVRGVVKEVHRRPNHKLKHVQVCPGHYLIRGMVKKASLKTVRQSLQALSNKNAVKATNLLSIHTQKLQKRS
jgi:hypothetical protein